MIWRGDDLLELALAAMTAEEARLAAEQAVHGLDAGDEKALQPLLAAALAAGGRTVLREVPYPHEWWDRFAPDAEGPASPPLDRDRLRCDLVVLPEGATRLADSARAARKSAGVRAEGAGTLFEQVAEADAARTVDVGAPPEEAYWLEVKTVFQFAHASTGEAAQNPRYSGEMLRGPSTDLSKLAKDKRVRHAGVLVVVFANDEQTARHDLIQLAHRCLDRQIPAGSPTTAGFPIVDRIGNAVCVLSLIPLRKPVD